jgi:DMSO reductase family type II enzyme molybdopterin subunit
MYDPTRIKYPLKRVGERGGGKWQRVSWDEALSEIADTIIEVATKEGLDTILQDIGTNFSLAVQGLALFRLKNLLGFPLLDNNPEIGDDHGGVAVTLGSMVGCNSLDDWFYSDIVLLWTGNPHYTGIPNSHFLWEARYNGTEIIAITPDYSPSSIHADLWIPIKVGTDAALALSLCHVILKEKLYNEAFIREQTDLPFLIREDNNAFLREKDLNEHGREDTFFLYDTVEGKIKPAPKDSLNLGTLVPALEGEYEAETREGKIKVRPVFELIKQRLEDYSPEKVSRITGIKPALIRLLAKKIAQAKAVTNVTNSCFSKFYYGYLTERAQLLLFALCGHFGKKGSGYVGFPIILYESVFLLGLAPSLSHPLEAVEELRKGLAPKLKALTEAGYTEQMISFELARESFKRGDWVSSTIFWNIHGGILGLNKDLKKWDKHLTRDSLESYLKESLEKNWQYVYPQPDKEPRVLLEYGGNIIRRVRGYPALLDTLWPKLKLIVTIDWRMSSTGLYSDFVLPAAGWYEKIDFGAATPYNPFVQICDKAVSPLYESKSEWEIYCLLAKKIQERAKAQGISSIKDWLGEEKRLDTLYDDLTFQGYYSEKDDEKVAKDLLQVATEFKTDLKEMREKGWKRFENIGKSSFSIGNATDIKPDETITPYTWHTAKKIPWPTLTRRIQFYIDHPLYLELGEELPVYKEPPKVGGDYPLVVTGGHTRWSIHSFWRDETLLLRLQRGQPVMYMSTDDAKARGVVDGEIVRVKNDLDAFEIMAKVSPAVRPGQVIIYHAWEKYQFKDGKMFQNLMPSPINPIELAGGYFHLRPFLFELNPGQNDRDTRVEVVKIT